jgi:hypothetical protein
MTNHQRAFRSKKRAKAKAAEEIAAAKEEAQAAMAQYLARPQEDLRHLAEVAAARVRDLDAAAAALSAPMPRVKSWREQHPEEAKAWQRTYNAGRMARTHALKLTEAKLAVAAASEHVRAVEELRVPEHLKSSALKHRLATAELAAMQADAHGEASAAAKKLRRLTLRSQQLALRSGMSATETGRGRLSAAGSCDEVPVAGQDSGGR